MKIILFGNQGQIGREVEELAIGEKFQVAGFNHSNGDITNVNQLKDIFQQHSADADVVINAAAYVAVDKAEDEPEAAYAINCTGVKNLATLCKQYNLPLLHISTDYVFDGTSEIPYQESDPTSPINVYGQSKLAGELALQETWAHHIILRVSWVFGRYGASNFVKTILRLSCDRQTINVIGDQFGCPTCAKDIARVLLLLAQGIKNADNHPSNKTSLHPSNEVEPPAGIAPGEAKSKYGIYNYCGYPATTWYEFARQIILQKQLFDKSCTTEIKEITSREYPTKAKRPKNSELAVAKIIDDYDIPRHQWSDYLVEVVRYLA
jgi:dTDP-4-dehydrorhamnose reductase